MAESWDNVGLLVGNRDREVSSILLGLDPTNRLLEEALEIGADTVITHHPAIFKPIPSIDTAQPAGSFLEKALSFRLNIIALHTNFDSVAPGVNDALADLLGLVNTKPLVSSDDTPGNSCGLGRIGQLPQKANGRAFIDTVLEVLQLDAIQVAGQLPEEITTVAICGGSGSDFAEIARQKGADIYISAEIKHNVARWAEECGFCIADGTHYATEKPAVEKLSRLLRDYFDNQGWPIVVNRTQKEKHPFSVVINNKNPLSFKTTGEAS